MGSECALSVGSVGLRSQHQLCKSRRVSEASRILGWLSHHFLAKELLFSGLHTSYGASLVSQLVKNPPAMQETPV